VRVGQEAILGTLTHPTNTPANALWLSSLPEACRAEACLCGRARAMAASIDGVDLRELPNSGRGR